jgi:hypothetical protein
MLREFATSQILRRITSRLDVPPDEAKLRASLVGSQIIGLGLARYLIKIEPLASLEPEQVAGLVGPTLQRYLTGPL